MAVGQIARKGTFKGYCTPHSYGPGPIIEIASGEIPCWKGNSSLWADAADARKAGVTSFNCRVYAMVQDFEEWAPNGMPEILEIFVVPKGYHADQFGLLYTDDTFERGVNKLLKDAGFPIKIRSYSGGECTIGYTEQGMQGQNYVSMDTCNKELIEAVVTKYAKKLGLNLKRRKEEAAKQQVKLDAAIADLKSLRVGLKLIKSWGGPTDPKFSFRSDTTIGSISQRLRKLGWSSSTKIDRMGGGFEKNGAKLYIQRRRKEDAYNGIRNIISVYADD